MDFFFRCQFVSVLHQDPAAALEDLTGLRVCLALDRAPHLGEAFIELFHHMEAVGNDLSVGKPGLHRQAIRSPHVHGDDLDGLSLCLTAIVQPGFQAFFLARFQDVQHAVAIQI